jgi:hypothetical protein
VSPVKEGDVARLLPLLDIQGGSCCNPDASQINAMNEPESLDTEEVNRKCPQKI